MNKLVIILLFVLSTSTVKQKTDFKSVNNFKISKIDKIVKKNSYEYSITFKQKEYSLIVKTESYIKTKVRDKDIFDFNEPIVYQKLYFIKKKDTIKIITIDSQKGKLKIKGEKSDFIYSKNQIKFLTIIEGENGFFYYLTGGEDCVSNCPEYVAFYDKRGNLLWKNYLKNEGNYTKTLNLFKIKKSVFNKNSLKLIRVTPYKEIGAVVNSSLVKFIEN